MTGATPFYRGSRPPAAQLDPDQPGHMTPRAVESRFLRLQREPQHASTFMHYKEDLVVAPLLPEPGPYELQLQAFSYPLPPPRNHDTGTQVISARWKEAALRPQIQEE